MNDKNFTENLTECRNKISELIDSLVKESLESFSTYDEAVREIRKCKFILWGNVGELIIQESIKRVQEIALKKPTK